MSVCESLRVYVNSLSLECQSLECQSLECQSLECQSHVWYVCVCESMCMSVCASLCVYVNSLCVCIYIVK